MANQDAPLEITNARHQTAPFFQERRFDVDIWLGKWGGKIQPAANHSTRREALLDTNKRRQEEGGERNKPPKGGEKETSPMPWGKKGKGQKKERNRGIRTSGKRHRNLKKTVNRRDKEKKGTWQGMRAPTQEQNTLLKKPEKKEKRNELEHNHKKTRTRSIGKKKSRPQTPVGDLATHKKVIHFQRRRSTK